MSHNGGQQSAIVHPAMQKCRSSSPGTTGSQTPRRFQSLTAATVKGEIESRASDIITNFQDLADLYRLSYSRNVELAEAVDDAFKPLFSQTDLALRFIERSVERNPEYMLEIITFRVDGVIASAKAHSQSVSVQKLCANPKLEELQRHRHELVRRVANNGLIKFNFPENPYAIGLYNKGRFEPIRLQEQVDRRLLELAFPQPKQEKDPCNIL